MHRLKYYDTLKFFAIFLVCFTHFIGWFHGEYFKYYEIMPYSLLVNGLTGKLGVIILGQVMCVFAYNSSQKNPIKYFVTRYLYFVVCGAMINCLYIVSGIYTEDISIGQFFTHSFQLSAAIFPTFWCMRIFLLAGLVAYMNGKTQASAIIIIFEVVLLWLSGNFWMAACVMGCLAQSIRNKSLLNILQKPVVKAIILFAIFWAIKRPESYEAYWIDAICTALFIVVLECSDFVRKLLSGIRFLSFLGKYTMTVFMVHNGVYLLVSKKLFEIQMFDNISYPIVFVIVFIASFILIYLIAIPLQKILDKIIEIIRRGYDLLDVKK